MDDWEIVKLAYALLGKWVARLAAYCCLVLGALWALPWAADRYALIGEKYAGVTWTTQSFMDLVLALVVLGLLASIIAAAVRVTGLLLYRDEVKEIKEDIELIKMRLDAIAGVEEGQNGEVHTDD